MHSFRDTDLAEAVMVIGTEPAWHLAGSAAQVVQKYENNHVMHISKCSHDFVHDFKTRITFPTIQQKTVISQHLLHVCTLYFSVVLLCTSRTFEVDTPQKDICSDRPIRSQLRPFSLGTRLFDFRRP